MEVDFYVLSTTDAGERNRYACRLTEKVWKMGHRVFINTDSDPAAHAIDSLLWTFSDASFVPHAVDEGQADPLDPVLIGRGAPPSAQCSVLVNLSATVPSWVERFERVAELIAADETSRTQGRDRFRHYRRQGWEVRTHEL